MFHWLLVHSIDLKFRQTSTGQAVVAMSPHPATLRKPITKAASLCSRYTFSYTFPPLDLYVVFDEKLVGYVEVVTNINQNET